MMWKFYNIKQFKSTPIVILNWLRCFKEHFEFQLSYLIRSENLKKKKKKNWNDTATEQSLANLEHSTLVNWISRTFLTLKFEDPNADWRKIGLFKNFLAVILSHYKDAYWQ